MTKIQKDKFDAVLKLLDAKIMYVNAQLFCLDMDIKMMDIQNSIIQKEMERCNGY